MTNREPVARESTNIVEEEEQKLRGVLGNSRFDPSALLHLLFTYCLNISSRVIISDGHLTDDILLSIHRTVPIVTY